jgi:uncharacterized damage-inducible protein DinB
MNHPSEIDTVCEHLERYRAVSLLALDLVPDDKLGWRLADGLRTIGELYFHLGQVESFYIAGLITGQWNFETLAPTSAVLTKPFLHQELKHVRESTLTGIRSVDAALLLTTPTVGGIPVSWPLRSWLWYIVEHEVHHKAQIGLYLFRLGIEAPFFAFPLPSGVRPDKRPLQPQGVGK